MRPVTFLELWGVRQLNFLVLEPPACGPDVACLDYHVFDQILEVFRGHHFTSDKVIQGVYEYAWFVGQSETF